MKKQRILRNTFISIGVLFAVGRLLAGDMSDGVLHFGGGPLCHTHPTIITFDVPDAGTGPFQGTQPIAINPSGLIAGVYGDASTGHHGFGRDEDGAITPFDVPGGGTGPHQGTTALSINPGGV